eukprot:gene4842-34598_t
MKVRDVDKLDPLPDGMLKKIDAEYLEKQQIQPMFGGLVTNLVTLKPMDPIQYMIDYVQYGAEYAVQDGKTGLPEHRRTKLMDVFNVLDSSQAGKISYENFSSYVKKYGAPTLTEEDLGSIFTDFQPR